LDVGIISDNFDPSEAFNNKVIKYSVEPLLVQVRRRYPSKIIEVGALIVNWRGAVSVRSSNFCRGFLNTQDHMLISLRTVQYGTYIWDMWHKATTIEPYEPP
jgi:hypothetical protein